MSLFDFVKDVGKKLVNDVQAASLNPETLAAEIKRHGFLVQDLGITSAGGKVTVAGKVSSQELREKVVLALGNVNGVGQIDDRLIVEKPEPESQFYTVKKGDTLSKISKEFYGNPMKYMLIFEANKPMLENPDKIYPGQALRIPKLTEK